MKISLIDAIGSFTGNIAEHWRSLGHEVLGLKQPVWPKLLKTDFIFCEWADENAAILAQQRLPVPLVVRLHRYELYNTPFPSQINWHNVDCLIFDNEYFRNFALYSVFPACPTRVIPNGLKLADWEFRVRQNNFKPKVAFVGDVSGRKGIQMLCEIIVQWPKAEFHLTGQQISNPDALSYLEDFCVRNKLTERVIIYPDRIPSMDKFLNIIDYLVSCSISESQGMAIAEAMAKGIKPLICHFPGAETMYPKELLWSTTHEFREIKDGTYNSESYRQWIIKQGWTNETQMAAFDEILNNPTGKTVEDVKMFYDAYSMVANAEPVESPRLQAIDNHCSTWLKSDDTVVDIGCGVGHSAAIVKKHAKAVTGIDFSSGMIGAANKKYPDMDFRVSDVENMDEWCRFANVATLFSVLQTILPSERGKLYAKLKRFDKILITIPNDLLARPEIVWDTPPMEEILGNLLNHRVSFNSFYNLRDIGGVRFMVLEKNKVPVSEKEVELVA